MKKNNELQKRINNMVFKLRNDIVNLEHHKQFLINSGIVGPHNGGILNDIDYEIREKQRLIYMLTGGEE